MLINGKRECVYAKTQDECRKKLLALQNERESSLQIKRSDITCSQWFDTWLTEFKQSALKKSTVSRYRGDIENHIKPHIGDILLQKLTVLDIQRLYKKELDAGHSVKSVKNLHGVIRESLDKAVRLRMIPYNVGADCELPKTPKEEMNVLPESKIPEFCQLCEKDEYGDILLFLLFTGMRESEAIGLTWDEIDFTTGYVSLRHQFVRGVYKGEGYEFTTLKNHNSRSFKLPQSGLAFLKRIKDKQDLAMRNNKEWTNSLNFVFTTEEGNFCTRTSVYKHGKMVFTQMGLPELRIHDLRHTFATLSLQQGMNIKTLSHILGHATVAFTMDKYGHVSKQMMEDATCQMEEIIQMQSLMNDKS